MMNNLKRFFLLVAISIASFSFSQTSDSDKTGSATIDGNYCLVLDNANELQEHYTADATELNWTSAIEAAKYCGYKSNNLVSYTADFDNNKILIQIHVDRTQKKESLLWWNEYLKSICK